MSKTLQLPESEQSSTPEVARRVDGGAADRFNQLQQTVGNQGVQRLVRTLPDRPAGSAGPAVAKADGEESETAPTEGEQSGGEAAGPTSGTLPDKPPVEMPQTEKGAGELKEDGPAATRAAGPSSAGAPAAGGGELKLHTGDVGVDVNMVEVGHETSRSRGDSVTAGAVTNEFANPDTSPSSSAFGSESFKAGYKNLAFTQAGDAVTVNFTLDINCPWGTNNGGRKDVKSGTDPLVTDKTYKKIVSDLTPSLIEKSWRAPRTEYWSEAICKRHEKFHSTDDKAWAEGAGKKVVTDYLASKTVNKATVAADLATHLDNAVKAMDTANFQFYTGGAGSYLSYAGEERAFGDGKQPYLDLAADVNKQGQLLEKAASWGNQLYEGAKSIGSSIASWFS